MTKYNRSQAKLVELIKEVFGVCDISVDTKAIVLLLAGTLPSKQFKRWIDKIADLNPLNANYTEINSLRCEYGLGFRNYIILHALQAVDRDISSDELQAFIRKPAVMDQNFDEKDVFIHNPSAILPRYNYFKQSL